MNTNYYVSICELQLAVLQYFEKQDLIKLLQTKINETKKKDIKFVALNFPILLRIGDLLQEDCLVPLVLEDPIKARELFQGLLFIIAKTLSQLEKYENDDVPCLFTPADPVDKVNAVVKNLNVEDIVKSRIISIVKNFCSSSGYLNANKRHRNRSSSPDFMSCSFFDSNERVLFSKDERICFDLLEDNDGTDVRPMEFELQDVSQIYVRLKIEGLSNSCPWGIKKFTDINIEGTQPSVAFLAGTIISSSVPRRYVLWGEYRCKCAQGRREIYVKTKDDLSSKLPICNHCFENLVEDPSTRATGEMVLVNLHLETGSSLQQSLTLIARDELLEDLEPGRRIEASVFVISRNFGQFPKFQISHIYPPVPLRPSSYIPPNIWSLFKDRRSSPWSFVLTLGYMFASNVCPLGTYHRLKIALLLSLTSMTSDRPGLSVLAVGKDESMHTKLLHYASKYAPRVIFHSCVNPLGANVSKDMEGTTWIEGGSLLRARGGVCLLNDMAFAKNNFKSFVCSTLESGLIRADVSEKLKNTIPFKSYPLRAALWSSYNPYHKKAKSSDEESLFKRVSVGDLSKSIADIFGIVIYTDEPVTEHQETTDALITLQILTKKVSQEHVDTLLQFEELKQYLEIVKGVELTFSQEAEDLLRGYYVVLRRVRGECIKGSAMPITAINTLTEVAKCHAKLSLRKEVEIWDAAAAVLLCEEAFTSRTGYSPLGVQATPHLPTNQDLHQLLGKKNDETMMAFIKQLQVLIDNYRYETRSP